MGKDIRKTRLANTLLNHGISNRVLDAVKHGRNITMLTAEKLCEVLECKIEDIVEFK